MGDGHRAALLEQPARPEEPAGDFTDWPTTDGAKLTYFRESADNNLMITPDDSNGQSALVCDGGPPEICERAPAH